jgi:YggT family protein
MARRAVCRSGRVGRRRCGRAGALREGRARARLTPQEQAALVESVLGPTLNLSTALFVIRIPMTWYPEIDGRRLPWALAYVPTEPLLRATRKVIPPLAGVDVSPIVWVGALSLTGELLVGAQGILTMLRDQVS